MLLYYYLVRDRILLTDIEMFETAYVAIFEKQGHIIPDYCEFINHQHLPQYELPKYMKRWLSQLQGEDNACEVHQVPEDRDRGQGGQVHLNAGDQENGHTEQVLDFRHVQGEAR